ncbi:MAG: hypothetical protein K2X43_14965 [Hyphomonadaceae bacterium]|jgi:hypothetical protein|nr:hypothetical protein [Hyphomonadaceae bacterium]
MHTVMMVGAGLVVLALLALVAAMLGKSAAAGARWFVPPWLVVSLINLYVGTTHGHTVMGELPFLAIVFGVPALAAYAVMRWAKTGSAAAG